MITIHSRTLSHNARIAEQESSTIVFVYCCVLMMIMEAQGMPFMKGPSRQVRGNHNHHDIWGINPTISTFDQIHQF